ncbi:hypothetical protein Glove_680g27 [Diversispora epigaea]|uniref:Uncharacterized protein n=1 Tax=Diversispora epigaea TaxID=1348612 RepID=A0A397G7R0_9GLOM|nr:hypothetical protein Glove_680g27 [Diversispora epigaea]
MVAGKNVLNPYERRLEMRHKQSFLSKGVTTKQDIELEHSLAMAAFFDVQPLSLSFREFY